MNIKFNNKIINENSQTYFIADIAANHDGSLARAKKLIRLAAKNGANAAKFQHFRAETFISQSGFEKIGKITHQKKWKKSVFEVYKDASINLAWNTHLYKECQKYKIDFLTSPYDLKYVDLINKFLPAYKIGSGDITWKEIIIKIAKKKKPIILASGASNLKEVVDAINLISKYNKKIILMQCNTNYTNSKENFKYINLNVLNQYKSIFKKKILLGLSDHTQGYETVLGAVALGARVIEKHFTDNNNGHGPDHKFSMNPALWKKMVVATRNLEKSLGSGKKIVEKNEKQSRIIQRRGAWANKNLSAGTKLKKNMINFLRPCPKDSISIFELDKFLEKEIKKNIKKDSLITKKCLI
jgi:sialic acid synthase SpsE